MVALIIMPVLPVMADGISVLTLRPDAVGSQSNLIAFGASTEWECVKEVVSDNDTTYIHILAEGGGASYYSLANHTSESGVIASVKIFSNCRTTVVGAIHSIDTIYVGGTAFDGDNHALGTSYETFSYTWSINPKTEEAWTWADIDTLQAGIDLESLLFETGIPRCTQVWVEVNYRPYVISNFIAFPTVLSITPSILFLFLLFGSGWFFFQAANKHSQGKKTLTEIVWGVVFLMVLLTIFATAILPAIENLRTMIL